MVIEVGKTVKFDVLVGFEIPTQAISDTPTDATLVGPVFIRK